MFFFLDVTHNPNGDVNIVSPLATQQAIRFREMNTHCKNMTSQIILMKNHFSHSAPVMNILKHYSIYKFMQILIANKIV